MRTLAALFQLLRLALITRGNFRGKYWSWRMHTALGPNHGKTRGELIAAALEYGRWIARLRK
jgi:hypothetical protein